mmetsp:Transcript_2880/g.7515  ORF Transcript_2880/g.7515 Transcript_2880/m.7515 type:complete len:358 (+) Transcript_2880:126-1199(+)
MSLQGPVKVHLPIPSLKQACIKTLQKFVDCIVDLGFLDPLSLRDVLCSASQRTLAAIEDGTREGSGRDISWYTWHLWLRHFEYTFGPTQKQVAEASLIPLPGSIPPDYVSPAGVNAPTAHWRRMLERKAAEEAARADAVSQRLRNLYGREQELKQSRKAEATSIRPPVKRRRMEPTRASAPLRTPSAPSSSSSSAAQAAGKAKMMQNLGLSRPQQLKPTAGGGSGNGRAGNKGCAKVTHTHRTVKAPPVAPLNNPAQAPRIGSREIVGPPRVHRAGGESSRAKEAVLRAKEEAQHGGSGIRKGLHEASPAPPPPPPQQQQQPLPKAMNLAQQQRLELQRRKQEAAQQQQQKMQKMRM